MLFEKGEKIITVFFGMVLGMFNKIVEHENIHQAQTYTLRKDEKG